MKYFSIILKVLVYTVLYAKWLQSENAQYKVEHYQQNTSDDNYTLMDTESLSGTTDTIATAKAKSYEGFTLNNDINDTESSGNIAANGSLIKQYYNRNSYTVTFIPDNGANNIVQDTEIWY